MSNGTSRQVRVLAWGALALVLLAVVVLFARSQLSRSRLPHLSQVQPFTLTNQLGKAVSSRDLAGRVWVGDIIFSRCGGPCPKMTEQMSLLQKALPAGAPLSFITLTTDPDYDTPAILKSYSEKFGADPARWHFLTGPKAEIKNVAVGSLKLATVEKEPGDREAANDLFVHSTMFVLVDKAGSMRGVYESLEPGFQEKIRSDLESLLREN